MKQWVDLEIPLEEFGTTACTISTLGYVKSEYFYDFAEEIEALKYVELERISSESNNIYLSLIFHKTLSLQVNQIFNSYDFKAVTFPEEKGKVRHRLMELSELIETSNTRIPRPHRSLGRTRHGGDALFAIGSCYHRCSS